MKGRKKSKQSKLQRDLGAWSREERTSGVAMSTGHIQRLREEDLQSLCIKNTILF